MSRFINTELKSDSESSDSDLDSEKLGAKVDNELMAKLENLVLILNKIFCWLWAQKLPAMVLAWENLQEVLHSIFDLHFVVVLHFISRLLYHVTGTPPWLLRPVKNSTKSELYLHFFWLPFVFHVPQALRFWMGIFTHRCFLLYALSPTPIF